MTIKLLVVGKTDSKELQQLITIYEKRLSHYVKFELDTIPVPGKAKNQTVAVQQQKEGAAILRSLQPTDILYLLDEAGKSFSSEGFAQFLQKRMNSGIKQLVLVAGGPFGFSPDLYARAQGQISLSKMTFSHQMVRLFIVEQLYRAFTILRNEPYHHQ